MSEGKIRGWLPRNKWVAIAACSVSVALLIAIAMGSWYLFILYVIAPVLEASNGGAT